MSWWDLTFPDRNQYSSYNRLADLAGGRKELVVEDPSGPAPDPIDPPPPPSGAEPAPRPIGPPAGEGIDPDERTPRSFHLSRQVLERARAAAFWLSRGVAGRDRSPGGPSNLSELVERALRREVERLEAEHNHGDPFPAVRGRMRTGPGAAGAERIRRAQRARRRTSGPDTAPER